MLATVMNCIYVSEIFRQRRDEDPGADPVCLRFFHKAVLQRPCSQSALEEGVVSFFAGGTGHPYFSTDTATVLRAIEIEADVILLAKSIDGVYDSDPKDNPDAKKYEEVSIQEVIDKASEGCGYDSFHSSAWRTRCPCWYSA